jgi:integrating conjugative element protein (TIGR03758 family)
MNEFALGAGFEASALLMFISSLVAAVAILWAAWVTWGEFEAWTEHPERLVAPVFVVSRGLVLLLILLFFIR